MPNPEQDNFSSGSDSILEMLSGVRDNVTEDVDSSAADAEWPSEPTDVEGDASPPPPTKGESGGTEAGTPKAGADKAPEDAPEKAEEDVPAEKDAVTDSPADQEGEQAASDTTDEAADAEVDADAEAKSEDAVAPVDVEKVEAEYQQTLNSLDSVVAQKYDSIGRQLQAEHQSATESYEQFSKKVRAEADAIYNAAVEVDPVTGAKSERPLLPSEMRRLDELRDAAHQGRAQHQSRMADIEARSTKVLNEYQRDRAVAQLDAWTKYIVSRDPRLEPYRDVVRAMALHGEVRENADGNIDGEELLLRAQYRAKASGHGTAPSGRVVSQADLKKAQQIQAEKRKQESVRERGLGTITAGKGGGGVAKAGSSKATPEYMKGASPEVVSAMETFDAYLRGEY